jgi:hypothetical protein
MPIESKVLRSTVPVVVYRYEACTIGIEDRVYLTGLPNPWFEDRHHCHSPPLQLSLLTVMRLQRRQEERARRGTLLFDPTVQEAI